MQRGLDGITASGISGGFVPAALSDVYFAATRPHSVRLNFRIQPQLGQEPIALGHLGHDLDTPVLDGDFSSGGKTG